MTTGFVVTAVDNVSITAPTYIFVGTDDGLILGYNPLLNPSDPTSDSFGVGYDDSANGSSFKGLTQLNGKLYVANFALGTVVVLDSNFSVVSLGSNAFVDPIDDIINKDLYVPYNVQEICGYIYVIYIFAPFATTGVEIARNADAYISVFDENGVFKKRFYTGNNLAGPYGICKVDDIFYVGNSGDGKILKLNKKGKFLGFLEIQDEVLKIPNLWALVSYKDNIFYCLTLKSSSMSEIGKIKMIENDKKKDKKNNKKKDSDKSKSN